MFAIVEIAGQQYKVSNNDVLYVDRLSGNEGDEVKFDNILLAGDDKNPKIGGIKGNITAKILGHARDEKVLVFHKKRRKGYQKLNGHRQQYTQIQITNISI